MRSSMTTATLSEARGDPPVLRAIGHTVHATLYSWPSLFEISTSLS